MFLHRWRQGRSTRREAARVCGLSYLSVPYWGQTGKLKWGFASVKKASKVILVAAHNSLTNVLKFGIRDVAEIIDKEGDNNG